MITVQVIYFRDLKMFLEYLGYHPEITDLPKKIAKSKICIFPGVGAFDASMKIIKKKKFLSQFVR